VNESDLTALAIYVAAARDIGDALDLIASSEDRAAMETLHRMLTTRGSPTTDEDLNQLLASVVERRIEQLQRAA